MNCGLSRKVSGRFNFVQGDQIDERRQHFVFESDPGIAVAIAAVEYELLQVLNAFLVTPENINYFGNALMVGSDDRHFVVNAGLPREFVQGHRSGQLILFLMHKYREAHKVTLVWHNLSFHF